MASAKDLAEQAFSLLTDALRNSEERAAELDAELKRKRAPKNRVEERAEVLAHRLESAEADCEQWRREAGQLEELLANERAKLAQLKKKLEVAESGPDKVSKKEVNYWRQRAEKFDADTRKYKQRIATLRNEIREQMREMDRAAGPSLEADIEAGQALAATNREVESLRSELAARNDEVSSLRHASEQALATVTTLQQTIKERETRIAEVSAELEKTRAELISHDATVQSEAMARADALQRELDSLATAKAAVEAELAESMARADSLQTELEAASNRSQSLESELDAAARRAQSLQAELDQASSRADSLQSELSGASERADALQTELDQVAARTSALQSELDVAINARAAAQAEVGEARARAQSLESELAEKTRQLQEIENSKGASAERIAELEASIADLRGQLDAKNANLEQTQSQLMELRDTRPELESELDQLRQTIQSLEQQLEESKGDASETTTEQARVIETLNRLITQRDEKIVALENSVRTLESDKDQLNNRIAEVEANLAEERECTINVNELANERAEEIEKLVEKVEEAEERYEEAKWRLSKAAYFEKLVIKRKSLIKALIEAYRGKIKANTALKAGIDGLRNFKAAAEQNQQKLLARADKLERALKEARETIAKDHGDTVAKKAYEEVSRRAQELEERLASQVELIQTLETELHEAKAARSPKADAEASGEVEQLQSEIASLRDQIERKDSAIAALEADVDEQQKKLARLRGSESETMRLKAVQAEDQGRISEMQAEIDALKAELAKAQQAVAGSAGSGTPDDAAAKALRDKEREISRLNKDAQDYQKEIRQLQESVSAWQKKYEFIATEPPAAYQSATEQ